jgi:hypothetical protein
MQIKNLTDQNKFSEPLKSENKKKNTSFVFYISFDHCFFLLFTFYYNSRFYFLIAIFNITLE